MSIKKWVVSKLDKNRAAKIAEEKGIPIFLAMLLDIRGLTNSKDIDEFLSFSFDFCDPLEFMDMDKAVKRIRHAIENFDKICVYGDYDVDGVTSTALMYSYLDSCGADVMYYIPERDVDGYGLNVSAIDKLRSMGVRLIITVDNGIVSLDEVDYANELGIDVVITDHHRTRDKLPNAVAVVDPYRSDCTSNFKHYAGVGVVFKLVCALEGEDINIEQLIENYSDLVALGTIADVVPLVEENRLLVKHGMKHITNMDRPGIRSLLEVAGIEDKKINSIGLAYSIIPRINASGRLGSSDKAVKLLLAEDKDYTDMLATELDEENNRRKNIEIDILNQVEDLIKAEPWRKYDKVMVIDGEDWHQGVIGIVSSRITDKYGKPSIIISKSNGMAKGSGRSIEGFALCDAINECSEYLDKFGGHPMAAGLNMHEENIEKFKEAINNYAKNMDEIFCPTLKIDCKLNPMGLNVDMVNQILNMEPFGAGNYSPLFGLYNMRLDDIKPVGGGRHLRLTFSRNNASVTCMKFCTTESEFPYIIGDVLDLAVVLEKTQYREQESLSIYIKHMKLSDLNIDYVFKEKSLYEMFKLNQDINNDIVKGMVPTRDEFALVYKYIRNNSGWNYNIFTLYYRLNKSIALSKIFMILDIMEELELINLQTDGDVYCIQLKPVKGKVDLQSSKILKKLKEMEEV